MREIKFRAWDRVRRDWVYFYVLDGQQPVPLFTGNFLWSDLEPWQQFTDLLDKNDKEIYEGDLVTFEAHRDGKEYYTATKAVQFDLGQFHIHGTALRDYHNIEVIGDVYQNPELLK